MPNCVMSYFLVLIYFPQFSPCPVNDAMPCNPRHADGEPGVFRPLQGQVHGQRVFHLLQVGAVSGPDPPHPPHLPLYPLPYSPSHEVFE
jgi:hypothetical protein